MEAEQRAFSRRRDGRGAAAVEFALVMPLLFMLLFGIIQYGLFFNDSLSTRTGVREGARLGVVGSFDSAGCTGDPLDRLACGTGKQIGALTGEEYVRVAAASWTKGKPLVVCAYVKSDGGVGLLPMPNGGWIFSTTRMSIEQETPPPSRLSGHAGSLPSDAPSWPAECL